MRLGGARVGREVRLPSAARVRTKTKRRPPEGGCTWRASGGSREREPGKGAGKGGCSSRNEIGGKQGTAHLAPFAHFFLRKRGREG